MNRPQGASVGKRKRPESAPSLTEHERILYDIICSREGMGIWLKDMKRDAKLSDSVANRCITSLRNKNLIKEVVHYQNKTKKMYMGAEFEPSKEITGGSWYVDGSLDQDTIAMLKALCMQLISRSRTGVVTVEGMTELCVRTGAYKEELTKQQVEEILRALVLDKEISQVRSNGRGDFIGIPNGKECYKVNLKKVVGGGAMTSIPCGVCPRISVCTPGGVISPTNCVYYDKWLDF